MVDFSGSNRFYGAGLFVALRWVTKLLVAVVGLALVPQIVPAQEPLPRIGVRSASPAAQFYSTETGECFVPEGHNYAKLAWADTTRFHSTFVPGLYDATACETALSRMQALGYSVVRVFLNAGSAAMEAAGYLGIGGEWARDEAALYEPYVQNFIDFLYRARAHEIYVIVSCDWVPGNIFYALLANTTTTTNVDNVNKISLNPGNIEAKKLYFQTLVARVGEEDSGGLLSTVLAWEVQNELASTVRHAPYSLESGAVTPANGQTYQMDDPVDRQALHDDGWTYYFDEVVPAVKSVDPEALVGSSCFTYAAVDKTLQGGVNRGVLPIDSPDERFPITPTIMAQSALNYIDVHLYPAHGGYVMSEDLESSLFETIDPTVKPLLMGEFGAFTFLFSDEVSAAPWMRLMRREAYDLGFQGSLLWVWDTDEEGGWNVWGAADQSGAIGELLSPNRRHHHWEFETSGDLEGWVPNVGLDAVTVADGRLSADVITATPILEMNGLDLDAIGAMHVTIALANGTNGVGMALYWRTEDDPVWDETKVLYRDMFPYSGFHEYDFNLCGVENWQGVITGLRLVPVAGVTEQGAIDLEWIRIESALLADTDQRTVFSEVASWPLYE